MKLAHFDIEHIFDLEPNTVNVLVIEGEKQFWQYCAELSKQVNGKEGGFCLSHKETDLLFPKTCAFISDYFTDFIEDKKYTTKLYQQLQTISEEEYSNDLAAVRESILSLFEKLNAQSDCAIDYDEDTSISGIFKAFGVKFGDDDDTLVGKLIASMRILSRFYGVKVFFFVGLKTVMSQDDLLSIYHSAALEGLNVFLLENSPKPALDGEKIIIIDRDLCEIVVK